MSNLAQFFGGQIKSIQRGVISLAGVNLTATATITAVDTSKTELRLLGQDSNVNTANFDYVLAHIVLTNTTTITATRVTGSGTNVISWELTERY